MSKNSKVFSPFAKDIEAVLKTQIDSTLIIAEYRKFGLNVERYFDGIEKVGIFECPLTKYRFYYPSSIIKFLSLVVTEINIVNFLYNCQT